MGDKRRGFNLPKALCIRERTSRGFCIRRTLSDDNSTTGLMVHNGADVSIGTLPVEERMQGHQIIEHLNDPTLRYQRNYDFQIEGSEADALIKGG